MLVLIVACVGKAPPTDDSAPPVRVPGPIRLFYMGSDALGDVGTDDAPHTIYTASSSDGVHFVEDALVFSSEGGNDPDIFPIPGGYGLFTSTGPEITLATSTAIAGTYLPVSVIDWFGGGGPSTIEIDGVQRLFFCGADGINVSELTLAPPMLAPHAEALANWTDGRICDPTVMKFADGDYRMFVHYSPSLESGPWEHVVYQASSTDGLHYTPIDTPLQVGASVAGAVAYQDVLYVYAVDARGGGTPDTADSGDTAKKEDTSGLLVGVSTDAGATFTFTEVVLDGAAATQGYDPDAIIVE